MRSNRRRSPQTRWWPMTAPPSRRWRRRSCAGQAGKGLRDPVEEAPPDDAATAPDLGGGAQVDVPAALAGRRPHLLEALRVGHDLGRVERVPHLVHEAVAFTRLDAPGGPAQQ